MIGLPFFSCRHSA
jgi:hypothetical protein